MFLSPLPTAVTVAVLVDVPPVILSLVVKIPARTTYSIVVEGELTITLPVAEDELPVITSPTVNVPVEPEIVKDGDSGAVLISTAS